MRIVRFSSLAVAALLAPAMAAADSNQAVDQTPKLLVGDQAPHLTGLSYLKGEALPENLDEPGKVYFLESWATWCAPCIASMPHLLELHQKYADRGLSIVAIDVFENDPDKVKNFVETHEVMDFPVAVSGARDSDYATHWLTPLGIDSIPRSVIVRDGKIVWMDHPSRVTDEVMEELLADDFDSQAFVEKYESIKNNREELTAKVIEASRAKNWQGVLDLLPEIREVDSSQAYGWELRARIALQQYKELEATIATLPKTSENSLDQVAMFQMIASNAPTTEALQQFAVDVVDQVMALDIESKDGMILANRLLTNLRFQVLANVDPVQSKVTYDACIAALDSVIEQGGEDSQLAKNVKKALVQAYAEGDIPPTQNFYRV